MRLISFSLNTCFPTFSDVLVSFLEFWAFIWNNCASNWANLKANATINTRIKIYEIEICSFFILSASWLDACNRTSVNTVSYSFADIADDGMRHGFTPCYVNNNLVNQPVK